MANYKLDYRVVSIEPANTDKSESGYVDVRFWLRNENNYSDVVGAADIRVFFNDNKTTLEELIENSIKNAISVCKSIVEHIDK